MPQHLNAAAERRHHNAVERASAALAQLSKSGKAITFASVAREAGVSTDFLYRQSELRQRIEQLRSSRPGAAIASPSDDAEAAASTAAIRALSAQLKEARRLHRAELDGLRTALAVAQGENLALRRKLAAYQ